jgi:hypothetical protein
MVLSIRALKVLGLGATLALMSTGAADAARPSTSYAPGVTNGASIRVAELRAAFAPNALGALVSEIDAESSSGLDGGPGFAKMAMPSQRLLVDSKRTPEDGVGPNGRLDVSPLPEPGTWMMILSGLFAVVYIARRRLD